jgi:UDP-N-acetylmuramoyl-tripeptide--D-alanyl-D-alanine ligase
MVIVSISTDSRECADNCLFVPIKGERFDGHDYIEDAGRNGALATLTEKPIQEEMAMAGIHVENTLKAYQALAKWLRETLAIPVVAVTGSSGKTTTKQMIFTVLDNTKCTLKNIGNLNNDIGLPKTLLRLKKEHECAVVELGMNHAGEIQCISRLAKPNIGVITNIGVSHIENLGSRENIFKAKMEMMDGMDTESVLIVNGDDDFLPLAVNQFSGKTIMYGVDNPESTVRAENIVSHGVDGLSYGLYINNQPMGNVQITQPGRYNVYNSLAAIAVGVEMGLAVSDIIESIKKYTPEKMRFNIVKQENKQLCIIDDAYNANPDSVRASLKASSELKNGRLIAVLGDMLELGEHAKQGHQEVGECVATLKLDYLLTIGDWSHYTCDAAIKAGMKQQNVYHFEHRQALHNKLETIVQPKDTILVKGSRGMKMEQTVEFLLAKQEGENK